MAGQKINIVGSAKTVVEAIDTLCLDFNIAEKFRHVVTQLNGFGDTYFSTIPRDIVDIIVPYIGRPRQRNQNFDQAIKSYNKFMKKYTNNLDLLKRDYPEQFRNIVPGSVVHIKYIANKLVVFGTDSTIYRYIGSSSGVPRTFQYSSTGCTIEPNIRAISQNPADFPEYYGKYPIYDPIFILPCGLILMNNGRFTRTRMPDSYKEFLYNIDTNEAVEVFTIHNHKHYDRLMDDYGDITEIYISTVIREWSDLTIDFLRIKVE